MQKPLAGRPGAGHPSWVWRRLLIFTTVGWSFVQLYLLVNGPDTRVNDTIAFGLLMLISVLVTGYTGLATAQDIAAIWTTRTARPYADPPVDPTPAPAPAPNVVVQGDAEIPIGPAGNRR